MTTNARQLSHHEILVEIERMQRAGYGERRINAMIRKNSQPQHSLSSRLRARIGRSPSPAVATPSPC